MQKSSTYFIIGTSTEVGKTIAAAIITQALEADYWKPIQSGDLHYTDTDKVQKLISNPHTTFHPNAYALNTPASPHLSAALDGIEIALEKIVRPTTSRPLVIEAAGGLLVPLNDRDTIADLIHPIDRIVLVSRHYLGSINHTLLTYEALQSRGLPLYGIIFSGTPAPDTERLILAKTGAKHIGTIAEEPYFDPAVIRDYAEQFLPNL